MTVDLYDALNPAGIPLDIAPNAIVASYIAPPSSRADCMAELAQRFPNHGRVSIAAHGGSAPIADVETGAMGPADIPNWTFARRAEGLVPAVYASPANWNAVILACGAQRITLPLWWAVVRAKVPFIPAGAVGNQYLGAGPYDRSIITDEWAAILMSSPTTPAQIAAGVESITGNYEGSPAGVNWVAWVGDMRGLVTEAFAQVNTKLDDLAAAVAKLQAGTGGATGPLTYEASGPVTLTPTP